jgi:hypothetical protein
MIVIGFSKYTSRYLSDFTKYFFLKIVSSNQAASDFLFFNIISSNDDDTNIGITEFKIFGGKKKLGKIVYITAQNKKN